MKPRQKRVFGLLILSAGLLLFTPTLADKHNKDYLGPRFQLLLGGFGARLDTKIRIDANEFNAGTVIDFESTLGMEDSKVLALGGLNYHFTPRHQLSLMVFSLRRTGFSTVTDIRFGDLVITLPTPVNSFFNTDVYALQYGYSILRSKKKDFGLSFGLNVQDLAVGITNVDGTLSEETAVTAPLPTFGVFGGHRVARKWRFEGSIGMFGLSYGDYKGLITNASANFVWDASRHVGLSVGGEWFQVDVEAEAADLRGELRYAYKGPFVGLVVKFGNAGRKK